MELASQLKTALETEPPEWKKKFLELEGGTLLLDTLAVIDMKPK